MKKITIIELGGTISGKGIDRLDLKDYQSGVFNGDDFLQAIPELTDIAEIQFEAFLSVSSTAIQSNHWIQLREKVTEYLRSDDCDGVVITHGTNTLEETAYFLHLTVPTDRPIVFVGAQRPFTALSTDTHLNLIQAVRVAASNEAYGKGVLVILNDEISSARDVTKTNTYRLETFQCGQLGFLGFVDPDKKVHFYRQPTKQHTSASVFAKEKITELPHVEIIYSYAGATGHLIEHIIETGDYTGIVVAGTGAGLASPGELKALEKATDNGVTVIRSSRVGNGRVMDVQQYEEFQFLSADNLLPQKARILLMLCLQFGFSYKQIQQAFDSH